MMEGQISPQPPNQPQSHAPVPQGQAGKPMPRSVLRPIRVGLAVAVLLALVVSSAIVAVIALRNAGLKRCADEIAAIENVKNIGIAQALYSVTKGKGCYADLKTLADEGLIDPQLGRGERSGYLFTSTPINIPGMPPMYDTTARPISIGCFETGNRSFGSNEKNIIYEALGAVDLKGTLEDRAPAGGFEIQ